MLQKLGGKRDIWVVMALLHTGDCLLSYLKIFLKPTRVAELEWCRGCRAEWLARPTFGFVSLVAFLPLAWRRAGSYPFDGC
jgi:hypothetical protein